MPQDQHFCIRTAPSFRRALSCYRSLVEPPRYHDPPIISIDGAPDSQLAPALRQRRRTEALLASLDDQQWTAATRCDGWDVADVVAHLISVNIFWVLSITQGLAGRPTRYLEYFDPAATPGELVANMRGATPSEIAGPTPRLQRRPHQPGRAPRRRGLVKAGRMSGWPSSHPSRAPARPLGQLGPRA